MPDTDAGPPMQGIPAGQMLMITPQELAFVHSKERHSGLMVDAGGRISLLINGVGVRARFEDLDALCLLGFQLLGVAVEMNKRARDLVEQALRCAAPATSSTTPPEGKPNE